MKIIFLILLFMLGACTRKSDIQNLLSTPREIVSVEKFVPEPYGEVNQFLNSMGTTEKDYSECIRDLKNLKHDYYKMKYKSEGLIIESYIGLPSNFDAKKKYPLIINNRGGNRDFGKFNVCGLVFGDSLFSLIGDSIIYSSEVRGTTGSEGRDEFGGSEIADIETSYRLLSQYKFVDQKNKFMFGWSRGSITAFLSMKRGLRFNSVVVVGSVPDLEVGGEKRSGMEELYKELIPDYLTNPKLALITRSANYWPEKINSPILIIHGEKDWRASVSGPIELSKKLKALDKPHKFILYPDSGHDISEHRVELKKEINDWFRKYWVY